MKAITKRLRVLRTERELSQIETAHRAGIKEYRYWRIEAGYAEATPAELDRLARVFKVAAIHIPDQPTEPAVSR